MPHRALHDVGQVLLRLDAHEPRAVIEALAQALGAVTRADGAGSGVLDVADIVEHAMRREVERPTALGRGFACPHARMPGVSRLGLAVATLAHPIEWGEGGETVRWVALVIAPAEHPASALKLLGQLARIASAPELEQALLEVEDAAKAFRWLRTRLRPDDSPLTAEDLMRPSYGQIGPDTPVPEITRQMVAHNLDCAGITDADRRVVGQVSADDLFTLGMPDFFRQLESVSFIAEFDPFERYFSAEAKLVAKDVMSRNVATCRPDATILEIVHLLSVKGHPKVFVVDADDRLLGVVDRIRVINRLLDL